MIRRPSILLLDEATSSLDNLSQRRVLDAVRQGITVVSVAHELDAALASDQVLVLAKGQVIERGHPGRLLDDASEFSKLVAAERRDQIGDAMSEARRRALQQVDALERDLLLQSSKDLLPARAATHWLLSASSAGSLAASDCHS